jgi:hypothetical protein
VNITAVGDISSRPMYDHVLRVNIIFCTVISTDVDDIFNRSKYAMYYVEPLCPIVGEWYHFELSSMST